MRSIFLDFRFLFALVGGAVIALGLFLFMHQLIANNQTANNAPPQVSLVNFVHVQRQPQVHQRQRVPPPKPPPPKNPPPQTKVQTTPNSQVPTQHLPVNVRFNPNSMGGSGVYIGRAAPATDASGYAPLTPIFKIDPLYPPQALLQGVRGTIRVCFMVEPDGSVSSPYITHATSPGARTLLGQTAIRTILKWKFYPKKVDGKPVPAKACQTLQFRIPN